ncbi:Cellulose synthase A catalytic subunit 4, partial [Clarias magur]
MFTVCSAYGETTSGNNRCVSQISEPRVRSKGRPKVRNYVREPGPIESSDQDRIMPSEDGVLWMCFYNEVDEMGSLMQTPVPGMDPIPFRCSYLLDTSSAFPSPGLDTLQVLRSPPPKKRKKERKNNTAL